MRRIQVAATEMGKFEYNNPLYIISLPKELRKSELLGILKENAGKLQSHYDTRATLFDILKVRKKHGIFQLITVPAVVKL